MNAEAYIYITLPKNEDAEQKAGKGPTFKFALFDDFPEKFSTNMDQKMGRVGGRHAGANASPPPSLIYATV